MATKRVAVIGAGTSGLLAVKTCLEDGLEPVCMERSDHIGGLWYYSDKDKPGQGCVMKSTVIDTCKELSSFSDFPVPKEYPNYMHNRYIMAYLTSYAEKFDLLKHIRFNTEIVIIKKAADFARSGKWQIRTKDVKSGAEVDDIFDAVMLCTGHHANKNVPHFDGIEDFQGKVIHTREYRQPIGFEDQRVVVIGIGNSGVDIACELGRLCKQVYLSTRRGAWLINKVDDNGMPFDMLFNSRLPNFLFGLMPEWMMLNIKEKKANERFDHEVYGLKPTHRFNGQHPCICDDLPARIVTGTVMMKPNIRRIMANSVEFEDGTVAEVDTVILATGYIFGFPYVEPGVVDVNKNEIGLYQMVFPPNLEHGTLAVIGCVQPVGSIFPISELHSRWATRVFKGISKLPKKKKVPTATLR